MTKVYRLEAESAQLNPPDTPRLYRITIQIGDAQAAGYVVRKTDGALEMLNAIEALDSAFPPGDQVEFSMRAVQVVL